MRAPKVNKKFAARLAEIMENNRLPFDDRVAMGNIIQHGRDPSLKVLRDLSKHLPPPPDEINWWKEYPHNKTFKDKGDFYKLALYFTIVSLIVTFTLTVFILFYYS